MGKAYIHVWAAIDDRSRNGTTPHRRAFTTEILSLMPCIMFQPGLWTINQDKPMHHAHLTQCQQNFHQHQVLTGKADVISYERLKDSTWRRRNLNKKRQKQRGRTRSKCPGWDRFRSIWTRHFNVFHGFHNVCCVQMQSCLLSHKIDLAYMRVAYSKGNPWLCQTSSGTAQDFGFHVLRGTTKYTRVPLL